MIIEQFGSDFDLGFAKRGDQNNDTIPEKPIFEERFVRFAYRWKYKDNQYSAFSPFSKGLNLPDKVSILQIARGFIVMGL